MYFLDCTGMTCPSPVLETKKILEKEEPDELRVAVDNEVSQENVRRFLESSGYSVTVERQEREILILGSRQKGEAPSVAAQALRVAGFIAGETLGRGDDRLGAILMKSFIVTLKELTPLPWRVILINGGVKLASEGSEVLPYLNDLENLGVEILACGTCLDFFGLKEKLRAGRASNMFEILSSLAQSTSVLKP